MIAKINSININYQIYVEKSNFNVNFSKTIYSLLSKKWILKMFLT